MPPPVRVLVVDHRDSFTYNLAHLLADVGAWPAVVDADDLDLDGVAAAPPDALCLSPGPGRPEDAHRTRALLDRLPADLPVLGVCLGMQILVTWFGGRVGRARHPLHGDPDTIHHDRLGIFAGLPNPIQAARYHSLSASLLEFPSDIHVSAVSSDGEIMGIRARARPWSGTQFHPESFLSPTGRQIASNFVRMTRLP